MDLKTYFSNLRNSYQENTFPSFEQRAQVLKTLKKQIIKYEQEFYQALKKDYGYRSEFDTFVADLLPTVGIINHTLKNLKKWMRPSKRHAGLLLAPSKLKVHYQPLGVVGIIVPWNFPLLLALAPTVQALAAGNKVMIKMSECTAHLNEVLTEALRPLEKNLTIIKGEKGISAAFSQLPFNHLVFTGSTQVGTYVAEAAAKNLTPVTLELGGKSPLIIAEDANLQTTVDSLLLGKLSNSGQICVAPDYILLPRTLEKAFITLVQERAQEYFPHHGETTQTHIINEKQYQRLKDLLEDARAQGAQVHLCQNFSLNSENKLFPLHLLTEVNEKMRVMNEEIFGPLLPLVFYDNFAECIQYINNKPRPLALYLMSQDRQKITTTLQKTHSGGYCINDAIVHAAADDAPFGGIGDSGIGHYHGKEGFLRFSHAKTVLSSSAKIPKARIFLKNKDFMHKLIHRLLFR